MSLKLEAVRFSGDDPEIALTGEEVAARDSRETTRALRRLHSHAVRITHRTTPSLHVLLENVAQEVDRPNWRAFVYPDSQHAASCFLADRGHGQGSELILSLSSQLVRDFDEQCLSFVIGHEFGHALFEHHGYPQPNEAESDSERSFLLELHRAAEFTADRVGLMLAGDCDAAIRGCLQLASGLPAHFLGQEAAGHFVAQLEDIGDTSAQQDFEEQSHPPLPLRAHNLDLFSKCDIFSSTWHESQEEQLAIEKVDELLFESMGTLRGGHGASSASKCADLASFWAVVALYSADNRYSQAEQSWIQSRFGERRSSGAMRFMKQHGKNSTSHAMSRFKNHCPHIRDARKILRRVVTEVLQDAVRACDTPDQRQRKVLEVCLRMLDS